MKPAAPTPALVSEVSEVSDLQTHYMVSGLLTPLPNVIQNREAFNGVRKSLTSPTSPTSETLENRWKQGENRTDGDAGSPLYGPQTEIVPVTLGKLQRRLSRIWLIRPDAVVSTTELARAAFPRAFGVITHNHRRSIRRAALRIAVTVDRSDRGRGRPLRWRAKRW
jgi:hypothetical protein